MTLSLGLGQSRRQAQIQTYTHDPGYSEYKREVLKAFKLVTIISSGGSRDLLGLHYTVNVRRLRECNRLGDEPQVSLWRSHFFACSTHFKDVQGAIFNQAPGLELGKYTIRRFTWAYILLQGESGPELLCSRLGLRYPVDVQPPFASDNP